jgi:hypothetical protein
MAAAVVFLSPLFAVTAFAQTATFDFDGLTFVLEVEAETTGGYVRADWPHWTTRLGGHCFTVRDKVLAEESFIVVTTVPASSGRCRVTAGHWHGPYTGDNFNDSSEVDIDHVVPLHEAHKSGGHAWDRERRRAYANDLSYKDHLIVVDALENRNVKGDRDPADYLPIAEFRCDYVKAWIRIKDRWELSADQDEIDAINVVLQTC